MMGPCFPPAAAASTSSSTATSASSTVGSGSGSGSAASAIAVSAAGGSVLALTSPSHCLRLLSTSSGRAGSEDETATKAQQPSSSLLEPQLRGPNAKES